MKKATVLILIAMVGLTVNTFAASKSPSRPNKISCGLVGDVYNSDDSYSHIFAYGVLNENKSGFYDEVNLIDAKTKEEVLGFRLSAGATLTNSEGNEIGKMLTIYNLNHRDSGPMAAKIDFYQINYIYASKQTEMRFRVGGADISVSCVSDQKALKDF